MLNSIIYENQSIPGWLPANDLAMLLTTIQASRAKNYVEVGTYFGKSAAAVSSMPLIQKVVSIDTFDPSMIDESHFSQEDRPKSSDEFMELAKRNINIFGKSDKVSILQGRSEEALEQVRETLRTDLIDFLFVDGEHTSKQVITDYSVYRSLMAPNGIIAFHDVARSNFPSATKAFELIREKNNHRIYMKSPRYGSMGFIYMNGSSQDEVRV